MTVRVRMVAPWGRGTLEKIENLPEIAVTWAVGARCGEIEVAEGLYAEVLGYIFRAITSEHVVHVELPALEGTIDQSLASWEARGWTWHGHSSGS